MPHITQLQIIPDFVGEKINGSSGKIMLNEYINTQSPIVADAGFLFSAIKELDASRLLWQPTEVLLKFVYPKAIEVGSINSPSGEEEKPEISMPSLPKKRLAFPTYDEEDILKWDVVIPPPPRPSGTIRVRLKFKGRRKPIPIEDPWAE